MVVPDAMHLTDAYSNDNTINGTAAAPLKVDGPAWGGDVYQPAAAAAAAATGAGFVQGLAERRQGKRLKITVPGA